VVDISWCVMIGCDGVSLMRAHLLPRRLPRSRRFRGSPYAADTSGVFSARSVSTAVDRAISARDLLRRSRTVYVAERLQLEAVTRFLEELEQSAASTSDNHESDLLQQRIAFLRGVKLDGAAGLELCKARYDRSTDTASAALAAVQAEAAAGGRSGDVRAGGAEEMADSGSAALKFSDAGLAGRVESAAGAATAAAAADALAAELSAVGVSPDVEAFLGTLFDEQLRARSWEEEEEAT
jgi:hypothetical protein